MSDLARLSDRVLDEARRVRDDNRMGGRHRRGGARSIGTGSWRLKLRHWRRKVVRIILAVFAILLAAVISGLVLGGIGFLGILLTFLMLVTAVVVLAIWPRMKPPTRAAINKGDVKQMVGRTELWLEHQRPALPSPAVRIVDDLGVQLDELGLQLQAVDQNHPQVREIRRLVGEVLPETVDSYRAIPAHLRREKRGDSSPDEQVTDSLSKISAEIDSITRQLAEGSLDDLAIKHRYLEYRSSGTADGEPR